MLNARQWTVGLGIVLIGSGFVLADTPVMRSILRRPAPAAPSESKANVAEAPSERKFQGFSSSIVLPRGRSQAGNPREAAPATLPDQPVDVPGLEVTFGGGEASAVATDVNVVPTPVVDEGNPDSPATRPIFDSPPVDYVPNVAGEVTPKETTPQPNPEGNQSQQQQFPQPRMNPYPQQFPKPNQEPPGFLQRRRMRRAGASTTPQQQQAPSSKGGQALVNQDGPSILDIEMPADAIPEIESRGTTAALPAGLEISQEGKKPLFYTR